MCAQTPFIIFLAIDPRIVVAAIETSSNGFFGQAGVNGHEYLDKIVQIPFVIPQLAENEKMQLCRGYLSGTNATKVLFMSKMGWSEDMIEALTAIDLSAKGLTIPDLEGLAEVISSSAYSLTSVSAIHSWSSFMTQRRSSGGPMNVPMIWDV